MVVALITIGALVAIFLVIPFIGWIVSGIWEGWELPCLEGITGWYPYCWGVGLITVMAVGGAIAIGFAIKGTP